MLRSLSPACLTVVFLSVAVCLLCGCGDGNRPIAPEAAADLARRSSEAEALFNDALGAPVEQKVDKLRRLTALYDDLPIASKAHLMLVLYLRMDPRESGLRPALTAAKTFADRKPQDLNVSEAFKLVAQGLIDDGPDGLGAEADRAWISWLTARIKAGGPELGIVQAEAAHAHLLRRRWRECESAASASLAALPAEAMDRRVALQVLVGDLRGGRLGDLQGARAAWHEALLLAPLRKDAETAKATYAEAILQHLVADPLGVVARAGRLDG